MQSFWFSASLFPFLPTCPFPCRASMPAPISRVVYPRRDSSGRAHRYCGVGYVIHGALKLDVLHPSNRSGNRVRARRRGRCPLAKEATRVPGQERKHVIFLVVHSGTLRLQWRERHVRQGWYARVAELYLLGKVRRRLIGVASAITVEIKAELDWSRSGRTRDEFIISVVLSGTDPRLLIEAGKLLGRCLQPRIINGPGQGRNRETSDNQGDRNHHKHLHQGEACF